MKRTIVILALAISAFTFIVLTSGTANALNATSTMAVGATMQGNCSVTTAPVNFGVYTSGQGTDATATGTVNVTCSNLTAYTIDIDSGLNYTATRRMKGAVNTTSFLSYNLYWDPGYGTIAGSTSGGTNSATPYPGTIGTGALQPYTIYAKLPFGQVGPSDTYNDTVNVTVTY